MVGEIKIKFIYKNSNNLEALVVVFLFLKLYPLQTYCLI